MGSAELFNRRYEKKYMLTEETYAEFIKRVGDRLVPDKFANSFISNIYFDTPDFLLIRRSIDGPIYKEKFRVRTYGVPNDKTKTFCEIKKKYKGIVYKRRIDMSYVKAYDYAVNRVGIEKPSQISREIDWLLSYYEGIGPAMYISYERYSLAGTDESAARVTFDRNITWRTDDLDLRKGSYGKRLLPDGYVLMELKIPEAVPLWLSEILNDLHIYPISFSKYGNAYRDIVGYPLSVSLDLISKAQHQAVSDKKNNQNPEDKITC